MMKRFFGDGTPSGLGFAAAGADETGGAATGAELLALSSACTAAPYEIPAIPRPAAKISGLKAEMFRSLIAIADANLVAIDRKR
jgi:hypothetical protein